MLKTIHGKIKDRDQWDDVDAPIRTTEESLPQLSEKEAVPISRAIWPAPFLPGLEYNSPAHGTWNIVHTGMLLPEAHQIYVCAANCNRGVVLTAAEMNARDRFSYIEVLEEDIYNGNMENLVIDGVEEILNRLERKPKIVLLFTVCLHHFMGIDLSYIYEELRRRCPEQFFVDCYMDCIMQKEGLTPDQKLRIKLFDILEKKTENPRLMNIVGSDLPLQEDAEIKSLLQKAGWSFLDLSEGLTFEEYLNMGTGSANLCVYPPGRTGMDRLSEKLDIPGLYLPMSWDYGKTDRQLQEMMETMGLTGGPGGLIPVRDRKEECEQALKDLSQALEGWNLALDASATPHVLAFARLLVSHGIRVSHIYADAFLPEEKDDFDWLRENEPDILICSVIHHNMRVRPRTGGENVLAVGQKAAYFHQTGHFVDMVEGGGLHGYAGILSMAALIREAMEEDKPIEDRIRRKGMGCACCL